MTRAGVITTALAEQGLAEAVVLVAGRERTVDQTEVLRTAQQFSLSAYDAQYVHLAASLGIRCLTGDQRMLRNAPGIAISPADFIQGAVP